MAKTIDEIIDLYAETEDQRICAENIVNSLLFNGWLISKDKQTKESG